MSSSTFLRLFSILIILFCLEIVSVVNGLTISETLADNSTNVATYDTNSENEQLISSDIEHNPQKAPNINLENLQVAIPTYKSPFIHPGLTLPPVLPKENNPIFNLKKKISTVEIEPIQEILTNNLPNNQTFKLTPEFLKAVQMFANYYYPQSQTKHKYLTGNMDPMSTSMNVNQQIPDLQLVPALLNEEKTMSKPNQQFSDQDDESIEEISTDNMLDEETFLLRQKFFKFIDAIAKNYYQQPDRKLKFLTGNTDSMLALMHSNAPVPDLQLVPALLNEEKTMSKPNQQFSDQDDESIEEISTDNMLDEDTFLLRQKILKFIDAIAKNYYQQLDRKHKFLTGNTDSMLALMHSNAPVPDNTQQQLVPRGMSATQVLLGIKKIYNSLFQTMGHSPSGSDLLNAIRAVICNSKKETDNIDTQQQISAFSNLLPLEYYPTNDLKSGFSDGTNANLLSLEYHPKNYLKPGFSDGTDTNLLSLEYHPTNDLQSKFSDDTNTEYENSAAFNANFLEYDPSGSSESESSDDANVYSGKNVSPTPINSKTINNYNQRKGGLLKNLQKIIFNDIEAIAQQFNKFIFMNTPVIFMEHAERAQAFVTCCQLDKSSDKNLIKQYVDNYHSSTEQMHLIKKCAANLLDPEKMRCTASLESLESIENTIEEIINSLVEGNSTKKDELIQLLGKSIPQSSDVKDIVYDYDSTTTHLCKPALILLWEPNELIRCETEYRWATFVNSANTNAYDKFNKEISEPFQQKALNLMISVNNTWMNVIGPLYKQHPTKISNISILEDQVKNDIIKITNRWSFDNSIFQHPMTAYYAKRAHAYKVCCEPIETSDLLKQYISYLNDDLKQGYAMNKLLSQCVRQQAPQIVDGIRVDNECSAAYNDLTDALSERDDFIKKYEKYNPNMNKKFREATRLTEAPEIHIPNMASFVEQYCPNQHVLELIYDFSDYINCDRSIRYAIVEKNPSIYPFYSNTISTDFRAMMRQYWEGFSKALAGIKTDDTIKPPIDSSVSPLQSPILYHTQHNLGQFMSLGDDASPMFTFTSQCSSIIFMLIIQIIFF